MPTSFSPLRLILFFICSLLLSGVRCSLCYNPFRRKNFGILPVVASNLDRITPFGSGMARYDPVDLAFNFVEPEGGSEDKPPLIFLHGVTSTKENWDDIPQIVANSTKRKAYVLDARNHGDSPWTDVFNFDCNVDDLLKFMDKIEAPSAIIVGHSMGGITAMKAALRSPERIEKLVIEDIGVRKPSQERLNKIALFLGVAQMAAQHIPPGMDEESAKKFIFNFISSQLPQNQDGQQTALSQDAIRYIRIKKTAQGGYAFTSNVEVITSALMDAPSILSDFEGDFKGPTYAIFGTESNIKLESHKADLQKHFPSAEFVGIAGATHSVHNDRPKEFTDALLKALHQE